MTRFPKRGQIWTYRDRGRTHSLISLFVVVAIVAAGIFFLVSQGNWIVLIIGLVMIPALGLFYFSNEKEHRDNP